MATVTFNSVPAKRLAETITGVSTTFKVNNILGWDGASLTSADFGSRMWAVFRNSAGTLMEIMEIDPTTITAATSPITIIARGLKFNGDQSTSVANNKLTWVKGDTIIELGTHVPQLFEETMRKGSTDTVTGKKTFPSADATRARIDTDTDTAVPEAFVSFGQLSRQAIAGAANASTTVKGLVEISTQAEVDARSTTGGSGALIVLTPGTLRAAKISDYVADTGAVNAYVITPTPAISAYAAGQIFFVKISITNTLSSTLNVNGLGAQTIKRRNGSSNLVAGDLVAGQYYIFVYDGTNMVLISEQTNSVLPVQTSASGLRLSSDGTSPLWVAAPKVLVDQTSVNVNTSVAETTLHTVSVPGGTLGTGNAIKIEIPIERFNTATAGKTLTLRLKYGGTTLATSVITNTNGANMTGVLNCYLYATGATNTQRGVLSISFMELNTAAGTALNSAGDMQNGTSAIDSTAAQTLVVTAQLNESAAATKIITQGCVMSLIS